MAIENLFYQIVVNVNSNVENNLNYLLSPDNLLTYK